MSEKTNSTNDGTAFRQMAEELLSVDTQKPIVFKPEIYERPSHLYLGAVIVHIEPSKKHSHRDTDIYEIDQNVWEMLWEKLCGPNMEGKLVSDHLCLDWRLDYGIGSPFPITMSIRL